MGIKKISSYVIPRIVEILKDLIMSSAASIPAPEILISSEPVEKTPLYRP
jgi:hypothetical protein